MPRKGLTFDVVREIALALPEVEESTMYGGIAFKVRGQLLTCRAINKSAEPETLAVRIDFDQRSALLAEAPETYYLTDHYRNYPVVLVRLSRIRADELRDLLSASWRFVTSRTRSGRATSRATARGKSTNIRTTSGGHLRPKGIE